jgi:phosphoribosylformylglycinamidine synthase
VSALSIVPDVEIVVASDWCCAGSLLYLVGSTRPHFGGSHHHLVRGLSGGAVPRPDLAEAPRVLRAMHAAIKAGCVRSCHDLSEGGLAVAAAESAFGGCLGATIELAKAPCDLGSAARVDRDAALLYSETPTRFLVEVDPARAAEFERQLAGLPHAQVGSTRAEGVLEFTGASGASIARWDIEDLRRAHQSGWKA